MYEYENGTLLIGQRGKARREGWDEVEEKARSVKVGEIAVDLAALYHVSDAMYHTMHELDQVNCIWYLPS